MANNDQVEDVRYTGDQSYYRSYALTMIERWEEQGSNLIRSNGDHFILFTREFIGDKSYGTLRVHKRNGYKSELVAYSYSNSLEDLGRDLEEFEEDFISSRDLDAVV